MEVIINTLKNVCIKESDLRIICKDLEEEVYNQYEGGKKRWLGFN